MADLGHRLTDAELSKLEKKIAQVYRDTYNDLQKKVETYFERFEQRDNAMKSKLNAGEITEEYYKQWRLAQMGRGERFEALRDEVADRMTKATDVAMSYINDTTPGIYSLNRNYEAYVIEQVAGDVGFTVMNEQTVKRLITEDPDLLPKRRLNAPVDKKWNRTRFSAEITSGIIQGESIKKLADRVQNLSDANRAGAIRNARTAVTGAQNAGRQATYDSAVKMGIEMQKEWVATLDERTRHSHAVLDGEIVDYDKKFSNGLMYPGDPRGRANEVWNCRCAMIAKVKGVGESNGLRRDRDGLIPNMTFSQWEASKRGYAASPVSTYNRQKKAAAADVTERYAIQNKKTGKIRYESGYKKRDRKAEIEAAEIIHRNYGGKLILRKEVNAQGVKTPDYLWGKKDWEQKSISTVKAVDSALRTAIKQIKTNPGGVVLSCNSEIQREALIERMDDRALRGLSFPFDVIAIKENQVWFVRRYKK